MAILVLSILINRSYFQLIAFKPGIYRVTASAEGYLSACTVFFQTNTFFKLTMLTGSRKNTLLLYARK